MEQAERLLLVILILAGIMIGSNLLTVGLLRGFRGKKKSNWLKDWNKSLLPPVRKNEHGEDNYEELSRRVQELKDKPGQEDTKSP
jgi:hypothetical protein